jgi:hypothetical protein
LNFLSVGNGNYSIVFKDDNQIYYSSNFQVVQDETYSSADLKKGMIKARLRQQLISHYVAKKTVSAVNEDIYKNYTNDSEILIHFYLKNLSPNVYSVNYEIPHPIYVGGLFVGNLRFIRPRHPKVIDLRGLHFVRNKY